MNTRKGIKAIRVTCIAIIMSIVLLLVTCVSVGISWFGAYDDCISITLFEKQHVLTVDKMILRCVGEPDVVVDNPFLAKRVTAATTTANRGPLKCPKSAWIELYSGDKLIRSMRWSPSKQIVEVCEAPDNTHILITPSGGESKGFVKLSPSLGSKLEEIVKEKWNVVP